MPSRVARKVPELARDCLKKFNAFPWIRMAVGRLVNEVLRTDGLFLFLGAIYIGTGYLLQLIYFGKLPEFWPVPKWIQSVLPYGIMFFGLCCGLEKVLNLNRRGGRQGVGRCRTSLARVVGSLLTVYVLVHFLYVFSFFKTAIPMIQPFSWDETLMRVDCLIHLGRQPWSIIHGVFGYPAITQAIDILYVIWFYLLFMGLLWMAQSSRFQLRMQFLTSFLLTWVVLGTVAATLFSSAGPCYYHTVVGNPGPYEPLMHYLRNSGYSDSAPLLATRNQYLVWEWYSQGMGAGFGRGISAMPSIHVATAVLLALAGWRIHRLLGGLLIVYALAVQVGSIYLGWHYAVDGYFAALVSIAIWQVSGRITHCFKNDTVGTKRRFIVESHRHD